MALISIFVNNILPVLLLSGAGFALARVFKLDPNPLGKVIFYILSPTLIFNLLTTSRLEAGRVAAMFGFSAVTMLVSAGLAYLIGKLLRLDRVGLIVAVLTATLTNGGNYGLPLVAFAFGQEALAYASIYFVTSNLCLYTFGVLTASLGRQSLRQTLLGLLKVPAIYAILLAMLFIQAGWSLPEPFQRAVTLAGDAAIPGMLILLGLELARVEWSRNLRALSVPLIVRLVAGPLIGLLVAIPFGLQGPARQAGVTESSMPTAVMTTVLANEYQLDPSLVTAIIFIGTLLSPLTLTPVLYFLGR